MINKVWNVKQCKQALYFLTKKKELSAFILFLCKSKTILKMKLLTNITILLGVWALYVNAVEQQAVSSVQDVCELLTSLSVEGQMV